MKMWKNLDKGETVFNIIKGNFIELFKFLSDNVKTITSEQRLTMPDIYYSEGSIVYDKTLKRWLQYNNGKWTDYAFDSSKYEQSIYISDWSDGKIAIPYMVHGKKNPIVKVYYNGTSGVYEVYGCSAVNEDSDVVLTSDLPFDGKAVIV